MEDKATVSFFFTKLYFPAVRNRPGASLSLFVTVVIGILGAIAAFQLEPPVEAEKWFGEDHMLAYANERMNDGYMIGNPQQYATLVWLWGVEDLDREADGFNVYVPSYNRGKCKYDNGFDLYQDATQNALLNACQTMRDQSCGASGCEFGKLMRSNSVICPLEEFHTWHKAHSTYGPNAPFQATVTSVEFYDRLKEFRLAEKSTTDPSRTFEKLIGFVNGDLKFMITEATLSLKLLQGNQMIGDVKDVADEMQKSIDGGRYFVWDFTWYVTQNALIRGLVIGMAIAFPVAFLTLAYATENVIVAAYAIVAIVGVVATMLGYSQAILGWTLGIAESVAGVIVIGFSVDYTIHLGHMYNHAAALGIDSREARFTYAIEKMGGTVVGGAITTAGSGIFMYACSMVFFVKMASMIVITIVLSWLFSLFFFMPFLYLCGPQGTSGHWPTWIGRKSAQLTSGEALPPGAYAA
jgi:hypothetical protein